MENPPLKISFHKGTSFPEVIISLFLLTIFLGTAFTAVSNTYIWERQTTENFTRSQEDLSIIYALNRSAHRVQLPYYWNQSWSCETARLKIPYFDGKKDSYFQIRIVSGRIELLENEKPFFSETISPGFRLFPIMVNSKAVGFSLIQSEPIKKYNFYWGSFSL